MTLLLCVLLGIIAIPVIIVATVFVAVGLSCIEARDPYESTDDADGEP